LASPPLPPRTSRWPRPSLPCGLDPTAGSEAQDRQLLGHTWSTRALRARTTTEDGSIVTVRESSVLPNATDARGVGPKGCGVGLRASARLWRASTRNSTLPSAFAESGPASFRVCGRVWRRGLHCTTSASGSTISSAAPTWPLPACWDGDLHSHQAFKSASTVRLRPTQYIQEPHPQDRPLYRCCQSPYLMHTRSGHPRPQLAFVHPAELYRVRNWKLNRQP
jgi:hypothetical protein